MSRIRATVIVDFRTNAQDVLGPLYAQGIIGAWNGYHYVAGGAIVSVEIRQPEAFDAIDAHPMLTRLTASADPTPDAVKQQHVDKLHDEVKAALTNKGQLDSNGKLKGPMNGKQLHRILHDLYGKFTAHFHPDF